MSRKLILAMLVLSFGGMAYGGEWETAAKNGETNRRALLSCWRLSQAWLQHTDPATGLIPRNLNKDAFWNAQDCAADNYPFLTLSAFFTDKDALNTKYRAMLDTEQRLCNRVGKLPDDYSFATKTFRSPEAKMDAVIFGASEYVKDGLIPLTERMGPTAWSDRMLELIDGVWQHAGIETEAGKLPTTSHEVAGDLLQSMSRMYWMTGKPEYKEWTYRVASYFLDFHLPTKEDKLGLDDHGCEVISGLSEAYFIAAQEDPEIRERWKPSMHAMLDRILETGRDANGLLYNRINPVTGQILSEERTDNWGYNYLAYATVARLDSVERYHEAIRHALTNLPAAQDYPWEGARADGFADSLEGCINLMNRYPIPQAHAWADYTFERHIKLQRDTGVFEGWHGDGNSARTFIMYALWKSQGAWVESWRADIRVGAVRDSADGLLVEMRSEWPWEGRLRLDAPRHKEYLKIPSDYPRLNQFPEWFVAEKGKKYLVTVDAGQATEASGEELQQGIPVKLVTDTPCRIQIAEKQ